VLQRFEDWVKRHLLTAFLAHVDETSININGKKQRGVAIFAKAC
jgi:transposase-like protein